MMTEANTSSVLSNLKVYKEPDPCQNINTIPLNGNNYTIWAKSVSLYICRKGKLGYIDGKIPKPNLSVITYTDWEINDRIVMWWLLNSMSPKIAESFLFLDSTKEIWDSVSEIYDTRENLTHIYLLQHEINHTVKGKNSFHAYFRNLKAMWDELQ